MSILLTGSVKKKILISILFALAVLIVCWFYLNSYYTLGVEDALFGKEVYLKHKLLKEKPKNSKDFVFINTGKDLALIDDTAGYGNIYVSDRYKILKLIQGINQAKLKPKYLLLDLQFYYPYNFTVDSALQIKAKSCGLDSLFANRGVDTSLQAELKKMKNCSISVLLSNNKIDAPIYKASYGIADYKTYSSTLNRFRLNYDDLHTLSIPALLHQNMDAAAYRGSRYATFCNDRLCFNYIWPDYFYDSENIKTEPTSQLYNLGSLTGLPNYAQIIESITAGKVVFVGNFEEDIHDTGGGKIFGTVILADIYLSLLNGKHYVPWLWVVFLIILFTYLSYTSIFHKLPEFKFTYGFAFADQIVSYVNGYLSYIGILMLASLLSILMFNIMVSLFLPAFIFSTVDFFTKKKYKPKPIK